MAFEEIARNMTRREGKRLSETTFRALTCIVGGAALIGFNVLVNLISEATTTGPRYLVWGWPGAIGAMTFIGGIVSFVKSQRARLLVARRDLGAGARAVVVRRPGRRTSEGHARNPPRR